MISSTSIRQTLSVRAPQIHEDMALPRAAVALILREGDDAAPDLLFIERAHRDGDPWSGDLGFPGGKVEALDVSPRRAAERETLEEVGLELPEETFLGRLDDLQGAHLPIVVSCFVYALEKSPPLSTGEDEVVDAFWIPLPLLADPDRHRAATVRFRDEILTRPAIDLLGPGRPVLWGITYRLVGDFLNRLGLAPPA